MTKHLGAKKVEEHVDRMNLEFRDGRAKAAADLYMMDANSTCEGISRIESSGKVDRFTHRPKSSRHL